jgi:hypothetical protein
MSHAGTRGWRYILAFCTCSRPRLVWMWEIGIYGREHD